MAPEEYALDLVITHVSTNGSNPGLAHHADSSGAPAFKLCDLRDPPQVEHRIPWPGGPHFTIFLAPNCANQTLAAGSAYRIVLAANGYQPTSTTPDEQGTGGSGWPIGDVASTRITGSWSNLFSGDTTVTWIWSIRAMRTASVPGCAAMSARFGLSSFGASSAPGLVPTERIRSVESVP